MARTIHIQFEGWASVADVVVDKIGRYAYIVEGAARDAAPMPVIIDVHLNVRAKVRD